MLAKYFHGLEKSFLSNGFPRGMVGWGVGKLIASTQGRHLNGEKCLKNIFKRMGCLNTQMKGILPLHLQLFAFF